MFLKAQLYFWIDRNLSTLNIDMAIKEYVTILVFISLLGVILWERVCEKIVTIGITAPIRQDPLTEILKALADKVEIRSAIAS